MAKLKRGKNLKDIGVKPISANQWYSNNLRKNAKAANERMRQLEKAGIKSPAYEAVQAMLESMGVKKGKATGRRFSETGKGSYSELEVLNKVINEFLNQKTSTVARARKVEDRIWNTANENNHLSEQGISKDEWMELWKNLPNKKRSYGSDTYVVIFETVMRVREKEINENKLSIAEIANLINQAQDEKHAYDAVGIGWEDVRETKKILGAFDD